jgi:predicted restriction endonuclease
MASEEIETTPNFETFRECVSKAVLQRSEELEERDRRNRKLGNRSLVTAWTESHDPEEMAEFVDVCLSSFQG